MLDKAYSVGDEEEYLPGSVKKTKVQQRSNQPDSQALAAQGEKADNRTHGRRTRKQPRINYAPQDPDNTDSEGEGEDYLPGSDNEENDASSEEEDSDIEGEEGIDQNEGVLDMPGDLPDYLTDTEDEEEDDEGTRNQRRRTKAEFREKLKQANQSEKDAWSFPEFWDCQCEGCQWVMSQFLIRPRIEQSTRWNQFKNEAPKKVQDMVKKGLLPTASKECKKAWLDLASTPILYAKGVKQFAGKYQKQLQNSQAQKHKLDNGRFHLWQLLEFGKWNNIPFPEHPLTLCEEINSPNMQKFAFAGYKQLLESSIIWLAQADGGVEKFHIPTEQEEGVTIEEFRRRQGENDMKARDNRMRESNHLTRIVELMEKNKPWAKMEGTQTWFKDQKVSVYHY